MSCYSETTVCGAVSQFMMINHGLQSRTVKLLNTSNKKMLERMAPPLGGGTPL